MATPYISMAGIGKSFGPVHALKSVNLTVYPGEIHALLGENGAGKSTLMKVLSGIHEPTKGTITINNINYNKLDHKLAAQLGIGIIYQELSVIDELTVCNFAFFSGLIGAQFWAERVQPKSPELDAKLLVSC